MFSLLSRLDSNHAKSFNPENQGSDNLKEKIILREIVFSNHAEDKFSILQQHGFIITKDIISDAVKNPDIILPGYRNRKIAQKVIDENHIIRVVFEDFPDKIKIITFYPGRRKRYEDEIQ